MKLSATWKSKKLYFKTNKIESLGPNEYFKIEILLICHEWKSCSRIGYPMT